MTDKRRELIAALRAPLGFEWDFIDPDRCALETASRIGIRMESPHFEDDLGLEQGLSDDIFGIHGKLSREVVPFYNVHASRVTPAMVAGALENAP